MLTLWSPAAKKSARPKWTWKGRASGLEGGWPSVLGHPPSTPRNQRPLREATCPGQRVRVKSVLRVPRWRLAWNLIRDMPGPHMTPLRPCWPVFTGRCPLSLTQMPSVLIHPELGPSCPRLFYTHSLHVSWELVTVGGRPSCCALGCSSSASAFGWPLAFPSRVSHLDEEGRPLWLQVLEITSGYFAD